MLFQYRTVFSDLLSLSSLSLFLSLPPSFSDAKTLSLPKPKPPHPKKTPINEQNENGQEIHKNTPKRNNPKRPRKINKGLFVQIPFSPQPQPSLGGRKELSPRNGRWQYHLASNHRAKTERQVLKNPSDIGNKMKNFVVSWKAFPKTILAAVPRSLSSQSFCASSLKRTDHLEGSCRSQKCILPTARAICPSFEKSHFASSIVSENVF